MPHGVNAGMPHLRMMSVRTTTLQTEIAKPSLMLTVISLTLGSKLTDAGIVTRLHSSMAEIGSRGPKSPLAGRHDHRSEFHIAAAIHSTGSIFSGR